jgi:hypothetical protein
MFSLVDLAKRIAGDVPNPSAPPPSPELEARVAESERRRELAEAELRREQEKKQEIKKAVLEEMSRLEAELNDTKIRVRRKDEEHGSALDALRSLKESKELEWLADRTRLQQAVDDKEKARSRRPTSRVSSIRRAWSSGNSGRRPRPRRPSAATCSGSSVPPTRN